MAANGQEIQARYKGLLYMSGQQGASISIDGGPALTRDRCYDDFLWDDSGRSNILIARERCRLALKWRRGICSWLAEVHGVFKKRRGLSPRIP